MDKRKFHQFLPILLTGAGLILLLSLQFYLHRLTPFMRDDFWYATDLTTGKPVSSFTDIVRSQIWHYFNWGGRIVNHGLLQAIIACGELWADIFNILATVLLGLVICLFCDEKNPLFLLLAESLIIAFNPSIFYSMYWQSGSVNYLYSSSWILCYVFLVIRELGDNPPKKLKGMEFWIIPLGLITGWSTENMGPTSFVLTVFAIIYLKTKKRRIPFFLLEGAVFTLVGSALLILAPGNFVRNQFVEKSSFFETLSNRIRILFDTTFQTFLFFSFFFAILLLTVEIVGLKNKLSVSQWALLGFAVVAQLSLILSPTYPQRTSFGIMTVLITFMVTSIANIYKTKKEYRKPVAVLIASFYLCSLYLVVRDIVLPVF